jgi:chromosome segregation ATPase
MRAIIREKDEAQVLTNEVIEVHVHYLRSGLDQVQAALPVLRDKFDALSASIDAKLDKLSASIDARFEKIEHRFEQTETRIDKLDTRIEKLSEKVSELSQSLGEVHGYVKTLVWVLSLAATAAAGVSIARTLGWISGAT